METLKDKIFEMFYIKHLKVKDIAEREKVSSAYITKVVKTDVRYKTEKEMTITEKFRDINIQNKSCKNRCKV